MYTALIGRFLSLGAGRRAARFRIGQHRLANQNFSCQRDREPRHCVNHGSVQFARDLRVAIVGKHRFHQFQQVDVVNL